MLKLVQSEDLLKFGLIPEFIGRLPAIVTLSELSEEALVEIMTEPKNALVKQYKRLFELDDIELEIEDDAVKAIAHKAMEKKTGARGLRTIMEGAMRDMMFELPSRDDVEKCIITKSCIEDNVKPTLVFKDKPLELKQEESA